jgi:GT2 family glycosyltransferase
MTNPQPPSTGSDPPEGSNPQPPSTGSDPPEGSNPQPPSTGSDPVEGLPSVSVVVATRDRADRLRRLFDGLAAQAFGEPFEVVVVDDGSTDETADVLAGEERFPLRTIRRAESGGPAAARNDGWRAARASLVAFTDDDCVPTPAWLGALAAAARADEDVVAQGRVAPDPAEADREGPYSRTLRVEQGNAWFPTANMLYPRALLERLGGFDPEGFPVAGEDTDLAWRAHDDGARLVFVPDALVHHAVHELGPAKKLKVAARWTDLPALVAAHPELRERAGLTHGIFWKPEHEQLLLALAALALPRRAWPLKLALAYPYARALLHRGARHAPYWALHDAVETFALARGSLRHRTLML